MEMCSLKIGYRNDYNTASRFKEDITPRKIILRQCGKCHESGMQSAEEGLLIQLRMERGCGKGLSEAMNQEISLWAKSK